MATATTEVPRQYVPLTCHGHSRPVPHISFSPLEKDDVYYLISACKGVPCPAIVYWYILQLLYFANFEGLYRQQSHAS